ncbi:MAG: sulfite exporter TauE/SafE family protein [Phycisphaerae bacterium]
MEWILILAVGVAAGTLGGVVGFGASLMLMPVLVFAFGPKAAVPIMAIAGLLANASRVAVWWRDVDWRLNAVYCTAAVPAAALGARLLVALDPHLVEMGLGVFFIAMIPIRRLLMAHGFRIGLPGMAIVGAGIGLLTGLVASTGPLNTPFFLAYGLVKGAFLATEALGSVAIGLTKVVVFRSLDALPTDIILRGLGVGSTLMIGSWLAKRIVVGLDASQFRLAIEAMMLVAGTTLLWSAATAGS